MKAIWSHEKDEWETPSLIFKLLDNEFHFDCDACATIENRKCKFFFSKEYDGLAHSWNGLTVFCNPPYSENYKWVKKAYDETRSGNTTVVMLLPARTDVKWFHEFIYHKAEIRFIKGRLKFGDSKNSAPFPSMIVIFRKEKNVGTKSIK